MNVSSKVKPFCLPTVPSGCKKCHTPFYLQMQNAVHWIMCAVDSPSACSDFKRPRRATPKVLALWEYRLLLWATSGTVRRLECVQLVITETVKVV